MPLIQVRVIEGVFTPEQRGQFISKLTNAMVSIEGENMCPVTSVVIEEARSSQSSIGGQAMTTDVRDSIQQKSTPLDPEAIEKMQEVLRARTPDGWA